MESPPEFPPIGADSCVLATLLLQVLDCECEIFYTKKKETTIKHSLDALVYAILNKLYYSK